MKFVIPFRPMLADTLKDYSKQDCYHALIAGLTVGVVALPLAMALAAVREMVLAVISTLSFSAVLLAGPGFARGDSTKHRIVAQAPCSSLWLLLFSLGCGSADSNDH